MHSAYYSNSRNPILQVHLNRFTFQAFLFQKHCWDPGSAILLQEIRFYKSTSSSGKFLHSFNIAESSNRHRIQLLLQELLVSHTPFVCTPMDQGLMQNQGHSSRTRILCGRSNKLLENKFYSVYRLIQSFIPSDFKTKKGRCCNIDQNRINILPLSIFHLQTKWQIFSFMSISTQWQ